MCHLHTAHAGRLKTKADQEMSKETPKIAIVGGGSTHWTPRLLVDFVNTEGLRDASVALNDIDVDSLQRMERLARHIVSTKKTSMDISASPEIGDVLDGADFVITALSVGGFESMAHDVEIPARYGVYQPVGDSVGPGGIFRSLRSIPVMLEIAGHIEQYCPEALLINVTNPLSALCRAVSSKTSVRTVGLCNELVGMQFWMSLLFDVGMNEVDPVVAGVNHLPLVTELRIGDRDGFAMLSDLLDSLDQVAGEPVWMDPPEATHWEQLDPSLPWSKGDVLHSNRLKLAFFRAYGVLPGSSDTHVAEFLPTFLDATSDHGRAWGVYQHGMRGHRLDKANDNEEADLMEVQEEVSPLPSGELVAPLLDSLITGTTRSLPVNLANEGQVVGLDDGVVVECIGVAGPDGLHPRDVADAGDATEFVRRVVASQELTIEAALSGDKTKVLRAMIEDPHAGTLAWETVTALTEEMFAAEARWLPQFA